MVTLYYIKDFWVKHSMMYTIKKLQNNGYVVLNQGLLGHTQYDVHH